MQGLCRAGNVFMPAVVGTVVHATLLHADQSLRIVELQTKYGARVIARSALFCWCFLGTGDRIIPALRGVSQAGANIELVSPEFYPEWQT